MQTNGKQKITSNLIPIGIGECDKCKLLRGVQDKILSPATKMYTQ